MFGLFKSKKSIPDKLLNDIYEAVYTIAFFVALSRDDMPNGGSTLDKTWMDERYLDFFHIWVMPDLTVKVLYNENIDSNGFTAGKVFEVNRTVTTSPLSEFTLSTPYCTFAVKDFEKMSIGILWGTSTTILQSAQRKQGFTHETKKDVHNCCLIIANELYLGAFLMEFGLAKMK